MAERELHPSILELARVLARRLFSHAGSVEKLGMLLVFLVIGAFVLRSALTPKPNMNSVNGTYYNDCCKPIKISDGKIIYEGDSVSFNLERMKFGLTAYPSRIVREFFLIPVNPPGEHQPNSFLFEEKKVVTGFWAEDYRGRDYFFKRK